jgi:ferritin
MLPKAMEDALNRQIQAEFESAYVYLSMSAYCEANDQVGFAQWLRVQAKEELAHAMKFFDHVNGRGGRVLLTAIEAPPPSFGSFADLFEQVLQHEVKISAQIHDLYDLAHREKDYASIPLLQWFLAEQVEEERLAADVLALVKRAGEDKAAILHLDRRLGERTGGA